MPVTRAAQSGCLALGVPRARGSGCVWSGRGAAGPAHSSAYALHGNGRAMLSPTLPGRLGDGEGGYTCGSTHAAFPSPGSAVLLTMTQVSTGDVPGSETSWGLSANQLDVKTLVRLLALL